MEPVAKAEKTQEQSLSDWLSTLILAAAALGAVVASIIVIKDSSADAMGKLKLATGYALLIFLFFLSMAVLMEIVRNRIDLSGMLEELSGGASMSRFQLLIFTFVVGFSFFVVVANAGKFPEVPTGVLTMLGISASTYAVSKGLQVASGQVGGKGSDDDDTEPAQQPPPPPANSATQKVQNSQETTKGPVGQQG